MGGGGSNGGGGGDCEIRLKMSEYDAALKPIQAAQKRSVENNKNYQVGLISSTDAPSVVQYQEAIAKIKSYIQRYDDQLQKDLDNLKAAADSLKNTDMQCTR